MSSMIDNWRDLYQQGYWLIPLKPQGKKALLEWKLFQTERAGGKTIGGWLKAWPNANPGIVTGKCPGVIVLDVDGPEGLASLVQYEADVLPATPTSRTARGWHYLFAYPPLKEGQRVITKAGVVPGLDSRGDGGYIVAPGAVHETGHVYCWLDGSDVLPLAQAPQWWLDLVITSDADPYAQADKEYVPRQTGDIDNKRARGYVLAALSGEVAKVEAVSDGGKHDRLLYSAIALGGWMPYLEEYEIEQSLYNAIAPRAQDKHAARKTIRDGIDYGSRRPRQIPVFEEHESAAYKNTVPPEAQTEVPKEEAKEEHHRWQPIPVNELVAREDSTEWLLEGYIAPRTITSLTAVHKSGKTTLLSHLYGALSVPRAEFIGQQTKGCKVLCISEEPDHNWVQRREDLSLQPNLHLVCKPFIANPDQKAWEKFVTYINGLVLRYEYDLVVFDTLPHLWAVRDENDAAQVRAAMVPLNALTESGAAVVIVLHPSKSDQGEGKSYRGSGVIGGFVNIICEMRRLHPEDAFDTNRVITAFSHYSTTPQEVVIQYEQGIGYEVKGNKQQAERDTRHWAIASVLPKQAPGLTVDEVLSEWPQNQQAPPKGALKSDMDYLASQSPEYVREGKGTRSDPYRYYRAATNKQWAKAS